MNTLKLMAVAALAVFALARPVRAQALPAGLWTGEIRHSGWSQSLALDVESAAGSYTGALGPVDSRLDEPIRKVEIDGDRIRLETDRLVLTGRIQGGTISGIVSEKGSNDTEGVFTLRRGPTPQYDPGSEPAFPNVR